MEKIPVLNGTISKHLATSGVSVIKEGTMKYLCLRNCFVNGQIYLKGETHELPEDMVKPEKNWQPLGGEPSVVEPVSDTSEKPREPKPGEYLCSKCNGIHRETSKVGQRHLKYK